MPGIGISISPSFGRASGGGGIVYETEYQDWLNANTSFGFPLPSDPNKIIQNQIYKTLKTKGFTNQLPKIARGYIPATENKDNARVSVMFPYSTPMTDHGVDWTQFEGVKGGPGKFYDTHFIAGTDAPTIWLEQNCAIVIYSRDNTSNTLASTGVYQTSPGFAITQVYLNYDGGGPSYALNSTSGSGLWTGITTAGCTIFAIESGFLNQYNNNVLVNSQAIGATALVGLSLHFPGRSKPDGSNEDSDTRQHAMIFYTKGDIDKRLWTYACEEYLHSYGKATPFITDINLAGINNGQSYAASIYDFAGSGLDSTYTNAIPNAKSGNNNASNNPFVESLINYRGGYNGSISELNQGLHYNYNLFAAHRGHYVHGLKTAFYNTAVVSTGLAASWGTASWHPAAGQLWDSFKNQWRGFILKNNPLAKLYHWLDIGQLDASDLTTANAFDVSLDAYCSAYRTDIAKDPNHPIFIAGINVSGYYTYEAIIRAKQIAYCAAHSSNTFFVDRPYIIYDGTGHPTAASARLEGEQQIDVVKSHFGL